MFIPTVILIVVAVVLILIAVGVYASVLYSKEIYNCRLEGKNYHIATIAEKRAELEKLKDEIIMKVLRLENELEQKNKQLASLLSSEYALKQKHEELKRLIDEKDMEVERLEEELEELKN